MPTTDLSQSSDLIPTVYIEVYRGLIEQVSATGPVRIVVMDYDAPSSFPIEWQEDSLEPATVAFLEQLLVDRSTPKSRRSPEQIARLKEHELTAESGG